MTTFVELLPRVETLARGYFHFIRCLATRDDLVAETMAMSWKWYLKLEADGRNPCEFLNGIVRNAARAAYAGRGFAHNARKKDAMNPFERTFISLPMHSTLNGSIFDEALHDPAWPVPDQAAFRIDFPQWRASYDQFKRAVMDAMAMGERTKDLAERFGLTPGRISQMREEFHRNWTIRTD